MKNIRYIVNTIGRAVLCEELECGQTAIANVIARDKFPASWYPVVKKLATKSGVKVSDDLFNWRLPK